MRNLYYGFREPLMLVASIIVIATYIYGYGDRLTTDRTQTSAAATTIEYAKNALDN